MKTSSLSLSCTQLITWFIFVSCWGLITSISTFISSSSSNNSLFDSNKARFFIQHKPPLSVFMYKLKSDSFVTKNSSLLYWIQVLLDSKLELINSLLLLSMPTKLVLSVHLYNKVSLYLTKGFNLHLSAYKLIKPVLLPTDEFIYKHLP